MCGQSVICIEVFPDDISSKCPDFASEFSKCWLSHPCLDANCQSVIIINAGLKLLYIPYALDVNVHAGMPVHLVQDYILDLKRKGYTEVDYHNYDITKNT